MATETPQAPDIQQPGFPGSAPMVGMDEATPADPRIASSSYGAGAQPSGTDEVPGLPGTSLPGMNVDLTSALFLKHLLDRTPQPGAPAPGSFGDKLQRAFDQFGAGMGDAAAANKGAVLGEGPRGAIARVEAARSERLLAQSKEAREAAEFRQRSAMNNIQMATHVQQLLKANQETRDKALNMNQEYSKAREADGWHVEHNVTENEARTRIREYKDPSGAGRHYTDVYEFTPVRYQEVNGQQMPIYDVIEKTARKVTPSRAEAEAIRDNGGPNLISKNSKGEEVITPVDNVSLTSMRLEAQRRMHVRDDIAETTGRTATAEQMAAAKTALGSKNVLDAMQYDPLNRVSALMKGSQAMTEGIKTHQHLVQALQTGKLPDDVTPQERAQLGKALQGINPQQRQQALQEAQYWIDEHTKALEDINTVLMSPLISDNDRKLAIQHNANVVDAYIKDPSKYNGKTPSILSAVDVALTNPDLTDDQRNKLNNVKNQALAQQKAEQQQAADKAGAEETARINAQKTAMTPGASIPLTPEIQAKIDALPAERQAVLEPYDPNTKANLISVAWGDGSIDFDKTFPQQLRKGVPGLTAEQAKGIMKQLNPDWDEGDYKRIQAKYKDATTGKLSEQRDSLNNFIGHAAEAQDITNKFWNGNPRFFKMALNEVEKAGWGKDVVALQDALAVVNGEFLTMVNSGHVPTAAEKNAHDQLNSASSTVGQINAALKVMGHMADTRANTMNENYRTATKGRDFPNLVNRDNVQKGKNIGMEKIDSFNTGGFIGGKTLDKFISDTKGGGAPQGGQKFSVVAGGKTWNFPNQKALDDFKKEAGIK